MPTTNFLAGEGNGGAGVVGEDVSDVVVCVDGDCFR